MPDHYSRYKALESVYATTIKYVGTTFAVLAADQDPELRDSAWNKIFASSSLGGWLDAAEVVCRYSKNLPNKIQSYCSEHSDYKNHPSRDVLDKVADHLNGIFDELGHIGYRMDRARSLSTLRALRHAVTIRNKCAHGALSSVFFSRIETDFLAALRLILGLIPFGKFVFWGSFGGNAIEFLERIPKQRRRKRNSHVWVESTLLSTGFTDRLPFLVYQEDSRTIYLLNDTITPDSPRADFLDYASGQVIIREVKCDWHQPPRRVQRTSRPRNYVQHLAVLADTTLNWREVPLTKVGVDTSTNEVGVYMFTADVILGSRPVEVILYVGKTTSLADRLQSYLRIRKGYDDSRPEITQMFNVYGDKTKLHFAAVPDGTLARVERAIYDTTMPEFNTIAPPAQ